MSALDALISNFKANAGNMPQVNPPAAAKVLETQTKPETEGKPEPTAPTGATGVTTPMAAASASPGMTAAGSQTEPAGEAKTRRTAAVVQAELDLVAAELAQTKAALIKEQAAHCGTTGELKELRASFDQGQIEFNAMKAELEKAVEFAKSVVADNAKLAEQGPSEVADRGWLSVEGAADYLKTRGYGIFTLGGL